LVELKFIAFWSSVHVQMYISRKPSPTSDMPRMYVCIYVLRPDSSVGGNGSAGGRFADDLEHTLRTTFHKFYGTRGQGWHETRQTTSKCVMKQRHWLARSYPHQRLYHVLHMQFTYSYWRQYEQNTIIKLIRIIIRSVYLLVCCKTMNNQQLMKKYNTTDIFEFRVTIQMTIIIIIVNYAIRQNI